MLFDEGRLLVGSRGSGGDDVGVDGIDDISIGWEADEMTGLTRLTGDGAETGGSSARSCSLSRSLDFGGGMTGLGGMCWKRSRELYLHILIMLLLGIFRMVPHHQGAPLCPFFPGGALPFKKKTSFFFIKCFIGIYDTSSIREPPKVS
jgi:hypothetical protein